MHVCAQCTYYPMVQYIGLWPFAHLHMFMRVLGCVTINERSCLALALEPSALLRAHHNQGVLPLYLAVSRSPTADLGLCHDFASSLLFYYLDSSSDIDLGLDSDLDPAL